MATLISKLTRTALMVALFGVIGTVPAYTADHYDGEETFTDPTADIADFYAFPTQGGSRLGLVMNVHPRAGSQAFFSDVIEYGFRIRAGALQQTEQGVAPSVGELEYRVICNFSIADESAPDLQMRAHCGLSQNGGLITSTVVDVDDKSGGSNRAMRVFAGLRSDPFFTDAGRIRLPRPRYKSLTGLATTGNAMRADRIALGVRFNGPDSTRGNLPNVLSIVVELDRSLLPVGDQLALVAETNRRIGGAQ